MVTVFYKSTYALYSFTYGIKLYPFKYEASIFRLTSILISLCMRKENYGLLQNGRVPLGVEK